MSEAIQDFGADQDRSQAINANQDTPPAPLNQSVDVRQGTIPPPSTLQYPKWALQTSKSKRDPVIDEFDFKLKLIASCTIGWAVAMGLALLILRVVNGL